MKRELTLPVPLVYNLKYGLDRGASIILGDWVTLFERIHVLNLLLICISESGRLVGEEAVESR